MLVPRRRIERTRSGEIRLRLPARERELLRTLPGQLRALLAEEDPSLARLFPPAYLDDSEADAEYDRLVRDELVSGKLRALAIVEETAGAARLDEEQLAAWIGALNDLRLVLGTRLGVTEDMYTGFPNPRDPRAQELALFGYLTWLQEQAVQVLADALPEPGDGAL
ncbi:MAG TPA: DUF2017 family protein [Gaiellaceae bacterium]|jgi:hypothetical protein